MTDVPEARQQAILRKAAAGCRSPKCFARICPVRLRLLWTRDRLFQVFDADVFELAPHGGTGVELESEDAVELLALGVFVGAIENEAIVHEMLDVVAFGTDDDVVEFIDGEEFGEFFGGDDGALNFLFAFRVPENFLSGEAHATTFATFFVDESGHVGQLVGVADFVLVATDNPFVTGFGGDVFGAVLNAGVVLTGNAEGKAEFKVFGVAVLPDEKGVSVGTFLLGSFATNDSVNHRPESGIARPTGKVFAVENDLHVIGLGGSFFSCERRNGEGESGQCQECFFEVHMW